MKMIEIRYISFLGKYALVRVKTGHFLILRTIYGDKKTFFDSWEECLFVASEPQNGFFVLD